VRERENMLLSRKLGDSQYEITFSLPLQSEKCTLRFKGREVLAYLIYTWCIKEE
jgi:hypothetical protein